jgi:hypothetical protein
MARDICGERDLDHTGRAARSGAPLPILANGTKEEVIVLVRGFVLSGRRQLSEGESEADAAQACRGVRDCISGESAVASTCGERLPCSAHLHCF